MPTPLRFALPGLFGLTFGLIFVAQTFVKDATVASAQSSSPKSVPPSVPKPVPASPRNTGDKGDKGDKGNKGTQPGQAKPGVPKQVSPFTPLKPEAQQTQFGPPSQQGNNALPGPPSGAFLPVRPTQPLRLNLVGGLSPASRKRLTQIDIDNMDTSESIPLFWRGEQTTATLLDSVSALQKFEQRSEQKPDEAPAPDRATGAKEAVVARAPLDRLSQRAGATLVRISPFILPGVVALDDNKNLVIAWDRVDACLERALQRGQEIIFTVQVPSSLSSDYTSSLVSEATQRYQEGSPARQKLVSAIIRWELACRAEEAADRYPNFVRRVRRTSPHTPVGIFLLGGNLGGNTGGDLVSGLKRVAAACVEDSSPLNSVGWNLPFDLPRAEVSLRLMHDTLARYPQLASTFLQPDLSASAIERLRQRAGGNVSNRSFDTLSYFTTPHTPCDLIEAALRLSTMIPDTGSNRLLGVLIEDSLLTDTGIGDGSAKLSKAQLSLAQVSKKAEQSGSTRAKAPLPPLEPTVEAATLALFNRMEGTRLKVRGDGTGNGNGNGNGSRNGNGSGIGCFAVRAENRIRILLWRDRSDPSPASVRAVNLKLHQYVNTPGITGPLHIVYYAPDASPSTGNAYMAASAARERTVDSPAANGIKSGGSRSGAVALGTIGAGVKEKGGESEPPVALEMGSEKGSPAATAERAEFATLRPAGIWDLPEDNRFAPGEIELTTLLGSRGVCLVEVGPGVEANPPVLPHMEVATVEPRGGDVFTVVLSARNAFAKPLNIRGTLTASQPGMLQKERTPISFGTVQPGKEKLLLFSLRAPIATRDTAVTLNLMTEAGRSSAISVPIQSALEVALETSRSEINPATGLGTTRVRLTNHTRLKLPLHFHYVGIEQEASDREVLLLPNSKSVLVSTPLDIAKPEAGVYAAGLRLHDPFHSLALFPVIVSVPHTCPKLGAAPQIDGDLSKWTDGRPLGMGRAEQVHTLEGRSWGGPSDLSAFAYTAWDERYFYFVCAVTDDTLVPPMSMVESDRGDSVRFAIGTDRVREFAMALVPDSKGVLQPRCVYLPPVSPTAGRPLPQEVAGGHYAIRRVGNSVVYEVAIPWSVLHADPARTEIAPKLSILVFDNDGGIPPRRSYLEWGGGLIGGPQPLLFPSLRLIK